MKETKYLGMVMDEHLTFKNHMDTEVKTKQSKWLISHIKTLC